MIQLTRVTLCDESVVVLVVVVVVGVGVGVEVEVEVVVAAVVVVGGSSTRQSSWWWWWWFVRVNWPPVRSQCTSFNNSRHRSHDPKYPHRLCYLPPPPPKILSPDIVYGKKTPDISRSSQTKPPSSFYSYWKALLAMASE